VSFLTNLEIWGRDGTADARASAVPSLLVCRLIRLR